MDRCSETVLMSLVLFVSTLNEARFNGELIKKTNCNSDICIFVFHKDNRSKSVFFLDNFYIYCGKRAALTSLRLNHRVLQQYGLVHRTLDKCWHNVDAVLFLQILLIMFSMISTENLDIS